MALDDDIRILSGVPFFEGFTPDQLRLLAFAVEPIALDAGETLYRENEQASGAFILTRGTMELFQGEENDSRSVGRVAAGALLGEFALISGGTRLTDAVAVSDCTLLKLDRRAFRRILEEYPDLASSLHKRVANDLQEMIARIENMAPRFS